MGCDEILAIATGITTGTVFVVLLVWSALDALEEDKDERPTVSRPYKLPLPRPKVPA